MRTFHGKSQRIAFSNSLNEALVPVARRSLSKLSVFSAEGFSTLLGLLLVFSGGPNDRLVLPLFVASSSM